MSRTGNEGLFANTPCPLVCLVPWYVSWETVILVLLSCEHRSGSVVQKSSRHRAAMIGQEDLTTGKWLRAAELVPVCMIIFLPQFSCPLELRASFVRVVIKWWPKSGTAFLVFPDPLGSIPLGLLRIFATLLKPLPDGREPLLVVWTQCRIARLHVS
jgi:hypothetical protein